ncbi:PAS domain-containing sensor histidine kinase [Celeribacter litoreus]|uniref:PAS domain-containing sensor histidine kinase n=1 Tax=Celeribacter litoreus TaxID=2876714 RepID=UPI001CCECE36|nr:ATP-binding protein [Celeribacter litoreus]MCA0043205.1 PAS domain-containing protein [Celeribacter litoreus]
MEKISTKLGDGLKPGLDDAVWVDVLDAVDKTYAELVDYQEQLETRNTELTALRAFLGSIMNSISDYLIVTDKDGQIADVSRSFCDAIGRGKDGLVGQALSEFFEGEMQQRLTNAIAEVTRTRMETTFEADIEAAGGASPVDFRVAPRLDRRHRVNGIIVTGRPLGELRKAYHDLEQSHEDLKQAQIQLVRTEKLASLGRLLAGVAHELNNPISFVYANTHSLQKYLDRFETYFDRVEAGATREELVQLRVDLKLERDLRNLRTAIEGARDGAERVRDIVADLRRLSSDGSGEIAPFDLAETAKVGADWVKRGLKSEMEIIVDGEMPCMALGRVGHVQQVIMNLVQNAADAVRDVPNAQIRVQLRYEGDFAILQVCDNGPGVPEDMQAAIFDPFFSTKSVGQGTGLGLSISQKIAEEHGGDLTYLPDVAPGACFRLTLKRGDRA